MRQRSAADVIKLPASVELFPSLESAIRTLRAVLQSVPDPHVELSVDFHIDNFVEITDEVARAQDYVIEVARSERLAHPIRSRFRASFPRMWTSNPDDHWAFCVLAYRSIGAEAYASRWKPGMLFSSSDAGTAAEFQLPVDIYRDFMRRNSDVITPSVWPSVV